MRQKAFIVTQFREDLDAEYLAIRELKAHMIRVIEKQMTEVNPDGYALSRLSNEHLKDVITFIKSFSR